MKKALVAGDDGLESLRRTDALYFRLWNTYQLWVEFHDMGVGSSASWTPFPSQPSGVHCGVHENHVNSNDRLRPGGPMELDRRSTRKAREHPRNSDEPACDTPAGWAPALRRPVVGSRDLRGSEPQ